MKRILVGLTVACLLPHSAAGTTIASSAFRAGAKIESFEGVVVGSNVRQSPFANVLEPGLSGSYAFASGIILSAPVPNPGTLSTAHSSTTSAFRLAPPTAGAPTETSPPRPTSPSGPPTSARSTT